MFVCETDFLYVIMAFIINNQHFTGLSIFFHSITLLSQGEEKEIGQKECFTKIVFTLKFYYSYRLIFLLKQTNKNTENEQTQKLGRSIVLKLKRNGREMTSWCSSIFG